jgi:ribosomal protein S3
MGQKVNPIGLRLGITRTWDSIWFSKEDYRKNLHEDIKIREFLQKKFKNSALVRVVIERFPEKINVNLHTAKPGVVIGQKGQNIENVKNLIKTYSDKPININIVEVKKPEVVASAPEAEVPAETNNALSGAIQTTGIAAVALTILGAILQGPAWALGTAIGGVLATSGL